MIKLDNKTSRNGEVLQNQTLGVPSQKNLPYSFSVQKVKIAGEKLRGVSASEASASPERSFSSGHSSSSGIQQPFELETQSSGAQTDHALLQGSPSSMGLEYPESFMDPDNHLVDLEFLDHSFPHQP